MASQSKQSKRRLPWWMEAVYDQNKSVTNSDNHRPRVAEQSCSEQLDSDSLTYHFVLGCEKQACVDDVMVHKLGGEVSQTSSGAVLTEISNSASSELNAAQIISQSMPFLTFKGEIVYSYHHSDCACICQDILSSLCDRDKIPVGFDMEWKVSRSGILHKTALIQMCFSENTCYLFHVSAMHLFPKPLKALMCDSRILLVGLNIECDLWKLEKDFDIRVKPVIDRGSVIDIGNLANKKLKSTERWSLDGLCRNVLGQQLKKDVELRCGQWDVFPLSDEQKMYAATDAFMGLLLYKCLSGK